MIVQPPGTQRNGGNCGIVAIAYAANVSVQEASEAYMKVRKKDGRWQGASSFYGRCETLNYFNVKYEVLVLPQPWKKKISLLKYVKEVCNEKDVVYIITMRGHVMTAKNGYVMDQHGVSKVEEDSWKRHKVYLNTLKIL